MSQNNRIVKVSYRGFFVARKEDNMTDRFRFQDNDNTFDTSVRDVLVCLKFAELEGYIPTLPENIKGYIDELPVDENPELAKPTKKVIKDCNPDNFTLYFQFVQGDNNYAISIETMLQCLRLLREEKRIPYIPESWWSALHTGYEEI